VIFGRQRFGEVIGRQLELFERDHADVIREAQERLAQYNAADRDEAEELYGDYVDAVETGTEILADIRDHFARTLDEETAGRYEREFNRAVAKRLPPFALEIENR
jgi:isocitrate dehydrogenase kinase/phosphatase